MDRGSSELATHDSLVPEGAASAGSGPEGHLADVERQRLTALYRYGLLGRDLDDALEDLVRLATLVCELPMGAVNLIDLDHQRQVATYGTAASDAPRGESYCDITISEDRPVVVSDTLLDPRFVDRAFTTGVLGKLRSYAGAQLTTPEGHHLGALCVFDEQPREVTPVQVEALELLAKQAMALFEAHRRADRLIDAEQRFRLAFTNTALGMALVGLDGRFLQVNEALAGLLGRDLETIEGMTIAELTHPDDQEREAELMAEVVVGVRASYRVEKRYLHHDGHQVWVEMWSSLVRDATGEPTYVVAQVEDISVRKQIELGLVHQATHDALTGLPNRALLADRMEQALAAQSRGGRLLVLSLDLDGFKAVNDTHGHAIGDQLLIGVADRLQGCVRRHDTVCRLGGDEFVVLAHDPIDRNGRVEELVTRIARAMAEPFVVEGQVLPVGMTIGGVSTTGAAQRSDELLRRSDAALYHAKRRCRGSVELVDDVAHVAVS